MKGKQSVCFIIAGPNGAGKTTFAHEFLPREAECTSFVNADLIAAGLSPFAPGAADIRAGRWKNFQEVYKDLVDAWVLYDNSGEKPVLLDVGGKQ